jgi:putative AlgH/UPF0301 family transcriptional regulator
MLYLGGPVGKDYMSILHNNQELKKHSSKIAENLFILENYDILRDFFLNNKLHTNDFLFIAGHSGWGKKQFEDEFMEGCWLQFDLDFDIFSMGSVEDLWSNILLNKGLPYKLIARYPKYPWWN